jgi:hypothetical protein
MATGPGSHDRPTVEPPLLLLLDPPDDDILQDAGLDGLA